MTDSILSVYNTSPVIGRSESKKPGQDRVRVCVRPGTQALGDAMAAAETATAAAAVTSETGVATHPFHGNILIVDTW